MGLPNRATCGPYFACALRGDVYSAVAYSVCLLTPNNKWANCVRNCLVGRFRCFKPLLLRLFDYVWCYFWCTIRALFGFFIVTEEVAPTPRPKFLAHLRRWTLGEKRR
jgi:hypothetical protein